MEKRSSWLLKGCLIEEMTHLFFLKTRLHQEC